MTGLVSAYQNRDVKEAEKILKGSCACPMSGRELRAANRSITADPFIQQFIDDLLKSLRTQYIVDIIKPYTRMELDSLATVGSGCGSVLRKLIKRRSASPATKRRAWSSHLSSTEKSRARLIKSTASSFWTDCKLL